MKRLSAILLLLALCALNADAWGGREHKLMAYMASRHLTPNTQAFLDRYLDQSIEQYASWMDRYRKSPGYEETDKWHMVSIDPDGSYPEDGAGKAIPNLKKSINILSNWREYNDSTVYINIVYVIHLVPEIHCPSHYFLNNKGWMNVKVGGNAVTYHALWDGSISRLYPKISYPEFVKVFDTWSPERQKEVSDGTPEDWAKDNLTRIKQIYDWARPGDNLPADFLDQHRDLPEYQAHLGAYRLARLLNDLFDKEVAE